MRKLIALAFISALVLVGCVEANPPQNLKEEETPVTEPEVVTYETNLYTLEFPNDNYRVAEGIVYLNDDLDTRILESSEPNLEGFDLEGLKESVEALGESLCADTDACPELTFMSDVVLDGAKGIKFVNKFEGDINEYNYWLIAGPNVLKFKVSATDEDPLRLVEDNFDAIMATLKLKEVETEESTIEKTEAYKYDTKTGELIEIATDEVLFVFDKSPDYNLTILGIDGEKLILFEIAADNSPGPGFEHEVWFADYVAKDIYYLDLNDTEQGLMPYVVPEYKIELEKQLLEEYTSL